MTELVDLGNSPLSELYPVRLPVYWGRRGEAGPHPEIEGITGRQVVIGIEKKFRRIERFMARLFKAPKMLRRPLDDINSLLWELMNGRNNFGEICKFLDETFHERISPVVDRCALAVEQFKRLGLAVMLAHPLENDDSIGAGIIPEGMESPEWNLDY